MSTQEHTTARSYRNVKWVDPKTGVAQSASRRIAELEAEVQHLRAEIRYLAFGDER